jgi:formamidopyrimidine-DNA glycosylase
VSIEMPEATILAGQMRAELVGSTVAGFQLRGCEKLQRIGFVNRNTRDFTSLIGERVEEVVSRGNTMVLKLSGAQNLILSPEYGGEVLFHKNDRSLPARYHFRLELADGSSLTVWIKTMGGVHACCDEGLEHHYLVKRDFNLERPEPLDEELTEALFSEQLAGATRQLKSVLVGKDALVVGLSNSAFQDVIFRAGLHPKRRASYLSPAERRALYESMRFVISERLRLGGKAGFRDLYGVPGGYQSAMGPALRGKDCPSCGTPIEKLSHGGGEVFVCPHCQPLPG